MDWKIELVPIPVTDVDRAKAFYVDQLGFHDDVNEQPWGRFVYFADPDGNEWSLQQRLPDA
ncbi:hypothetical protein A20C1_10364 [marine actinobacterium PHSC20C1]|nr:hypothetical protein A20C1_10364 [marine actinobacterium PHSC20C1]